MPCCAEHLRPDPRQRDLADRGGGLAFLQLQRAARQFQPAAAERDRAGRDDQDVAALAMQLGDVGGQRRQPRRAHLAGVGIDQQRGADLDDDAAEIFELRGGPWMRSNDARWSESNTRQLPDFGSGAAGGGSSFAISLAASPAPTARPGRALAFGETGASPITSTSARSASLHAFAGRRPRSAAASSSRRASAGRFCFFNSSGVDRVDLVQRDDLDLVGELSP